MTLIPYFYRMKCVIFGLGWLGLPLAEQLLQKGIQVTGTTRSEKTIDLDQLNHQVFNPAFGSNLKDIVEAAELIVLAFPPNRSSLDAYSNECLSIVEAAPKSCQFILISSTSVYPDQAIIYTEKEVLPDALSTNVILRCEGNLKNVLDERLTIVRMGGLVGGNRWPVRFMTQSGKVYAPEEAVNLIHQKDAVGIIVHLIKNELFGRTVNACSPQHPSKKEHYTFMAKQIGIAPPHFSDETSKGKIVDSSYSIELGYSYQFKDPNLFV